MSQIPQYLVDYGASKVKAAQEAFAKLSQQIAGTNVIQQITAAGKTKLIADAVKDAAYYGNSGSLWECYRAVESIQITPEMAPFLTEEKKQQFKNKLIEIISSL
jgi:hypothetical protein